MPMAERPTSFEDLPLILSVRELMPVLGIGRNKAYELIHSGQIRSIRVGKKICIPKEEILRFLKNNLSTS